jgi:hypothetical protein
MSLSFQDACKVVGFLHKVAAERRRQGEGNKVLLSEIQSLDLQSRGSSEIVAFLRDFSEQCRKSRYPNLAAIVLFDVGHPVVNFDSVWIHYLVMRDLVRFYEDDVATRQLFYRSFWIDGCRKLYNLPVETEIDT